MCLVNTAAVMRRVESKCSVISLFFFSKFIKVVKTSATIHFQLTIINPACIIKFTQRGVFVGAVAVRHSSSRVDS